MTDLSQGAGAAGPSLLTAEEIRTLYERFRGLDPHPTTELEYGSPYTLLVAVVLSAQATDVSVNRATEVLFKVADTPEAMVRLGEERLLPYIANVNLAPTKARHVVRLSEMLLREHGGQVPRDRTALEALPGVGRKTANVVLNTAFGEPVIAVDTHIFRVSNRTGLAPGRTPDEVAEHLVRITPDEFKLYAHHWLLLHGRYVCKARRPECWRCPVNDICRYPDKTPPPQDAPAASRP